MDTPHLTELLDVETLQRFQSSFSDLTGIAAVIADANGVPVTEPTCISHFCMNIIRQSSEGRKRCEECDKPGGQKARETGYLYLSRRSCRFCGAPDSRWALHRLCHGWSGTGTSA